MIEHAHHDDVLLLFNRFVWICYHLIYHFILLLIGYFGVGHHVYLIFGIVRHVFFKNKIFVKIELHT